MSSQSMPWIQIVRDVSPAQRPGSKPVRQEGAHALFAAQVSPRSFNECLSWKWGFNNGALLEEALERQRLFTESLHPSDDLARMEPPDRRTLAIRCINEPESGALHLVLVGKVYSTEVKKAEEGALSLWRAVRSIFPYDYNLEPLSSQAAFETFSGWDLLNETSRENSANTLAEVRRFEGIFETGSERVYLLGNWQPSKWSNEQIWRVLAGSQAPILLSITLRPTILYEYEKYALAEMAEVAHRNSEAALSGVRKEIDWASQVYAHRVSHWRYPYLLQVHLAAPGGINAYLPQMIGKAYSHREAGDSSQAPAAQAIWSAKGDCLGNYCRALRLLEPAELSAPLDPRFARLRYMADADETLAVFHFPFPPSAGIPGLAFSQDQAN